MLTRRGELSRLAAAARRALPAFGIAEARLRTLRHEHNTTFRVDAGDDRFVLRINRAGVHDAATVAAEVAWLTALAADTDTAAPVPVPTLDGRPLTLVDDRPAVLLRWQDGAIVDRRLTPRHLRHVGAVLAGLQLHASAWIPPGGFVRPRVDTITNAAKVASVAAADHGGPSPTDDDAAAIVELVRTFVSGDAAAVVRDGLDVVRATTSVLAAVPGSSGLLHGDLHCENVLFHDGRARAIDFDDCGWGVHLYDLAVTLWELEDRPTYPSLRDALLDEYATRRPLPADHDHHLAALFVLRRVQMIAWVVESRDHVAFRDDWHDLACDDVAAIAAALRHL